MTETRKEQNVKGADKSHQQSPTEVQYNVWLLVEKNAEVFNQKQKVFEFHSFKCQKEDTMLF